MFTLPFHVDSPLAAGLFCLGICLVWVFALVAYSRNLWRIGDLLGWLFERRFATLPAAKARRLGRHMLLGMVILFGAMALFGLAVGTGVVKNGDTSPPPSIEEFLQQHGR